MRESPNCQDCFQIMELRIASGLAAFALCGALTPAWASQSYQLDVPTALPYTRVEHHVAAGSFADQFQFTLNETNNGYVWLFARQDAWFGYNLIENTKAVSLTLRNNSTQETWQGVLYPSVEGQVSWLTSGVMPMVTVGFDPNKSLYISGAFDAGNYTATVSGIATGLQGSSYIAKFSFAPAVPEPGTFALGILGLAGLAAVISRRKQAEG